MARHIENIGENLIIGSHCSERLIRLDHPGCRSLRDLGVELAGLSHLQGEYVVERWAAPFHVVLFTLGGAGVLRAPGLRHRLTTGDRLIAPAESRFHYELGGKHWTILWFHLEPLRRWHALGVKGCRVDHSHLSERMYVVANALLLELHGTQPDARQATRLCAELLALDLDREIEPRVDPIERDYRARFAALWEQVDASLAYPWTIRELARRFKTSPAHLHRLCAEYCGSSPGERVFQLRMTRAEHLLETTTQPLKLIAPAVGYDNTFAFSSAFKRYSTMSPKQYRDSLRRG